MRFASPTLRPLAAAALACGLAAPGHAELSVGDLIVADPGAGRVLKIDPASGAQSLITMAVPGPFGVAAARDPRGILQRVVWVVNGGAGTLEALDPATGSVLGSCPVGEAAQDVDAARDGTLYSAGSNLYRHVPSDGGGGGIACDTTLLADVATRYGMTARSLHILEDPAGPRIVMPIAQIPTVALYDTVAQSFSEVAGIPTQPGDFVWVSHFTEAPGLAGSAFTQFEVVSLSCLQGRVFLWTDAGVSPVSSAGLLRCPFGIAGGSGGVLYVTDTDRLAISPGESADPRIVQLTPNGSGGFDQSILSPEGMMVFPFDVEVVPEPGGAALALAALGALAGLGRRPTT